MFKFKIGDEVYHRGNKKNLMIRAKIKYEDHCSNENYYDTYICGNEIPSGIDMVPEFWLDEGHRIE